MPSLRQGKPRQVILGSPRGVIIRDYSNSTTPIRASLGDIESPAPAQLHEEVLAVYELQSESLLRFARILTQEVDGSLAQDAVQEVFFRYFLHRRDGNPVDDPRRWLQRELKEYLAKAKSVEERDEKARAGAVGGSSEVEEILVDIQMRLPDLLSPRELQAMRLRAEGFRYAEIAEALNVTTGTVGTMIARAVRKLQTEFGGREKAGDGRSEEK